MQHAENVRETLFMKNGLFSFSGDRASRLPLINATGATAAQYRRFRTLLSHNHAALSALAAMEQHYYSGQPFSPGSVRTRYEELLEAVYGVIYSLEALTGREAAVLSRIVDETDELISAEFTPPPLSSGSRLVLPFEEITQDLTPQVGAKAANLARIGRDLKLPVPAGFCITVHAFRQFMEESGLVLPVARELAKISSDSPSEIGRAASAISGMILSAGLPASLSAAIREAYRGLEAQAGRGVLLAMRSSAIGEDTEATFAGQYTTVLNVPEERLSEAYKTVAASLYSAKAIFYRMQYGLSDSETPICVAGMAMIAPRSSGVLYTRSDPAGGRETMKITSLWGLGEQLVDGSAASDMFILDRQTGALLEQEISVKENRLLSAPGGGTGFEQVAPAERALASLDEAALAELRRCGLLLEDYFGSPQDIEWAVDGAGRLFILQARPFHMAAPAADRVERARVAAACPVLASGGRVASPGFAMGKVFNAAAGLDLTALAGDEILVAPTASPDYARVIGKVRAIVTDIGSPASHLASVAREFGVPALFDLPSATALLTHGALITLDAAGRTVYQGIVRELLDDLRPQRPAVFESPAHRKMRTMLDRLVPLNLTDPQSPDFRPEGCRTFHDIIRFTHESGIKAMFGLSGGAERAQAIRLKAVIPLTLELIDLGGGLSSGLTARGEATPEDIESVPLKAFWKGLTHPGITWAGTINLNIKNMLTLFASPALSEFGELPGGTSYAVISGEYANLSIRFGYHFAAIDTLCSDDSSQNYIALQFAGGAGTYYGKALRTAFLGSVLGRLGFRVSLQGDLLEAFLAGYDRASIEEKLDQLARLLASSRLLDMVLSDQSGIAGLTEAFFRGEYDYLAAPGDHELKAFYTHGGLWKSLSEEGRTCIVQDSSRDYPIAGGTAALAGKFLGRKVQELLDTVEAYYTFPLAIAKNSDMADGKAAVRVKPVSGRIDRAGGLAFGIRNSSNYFVLRINALEDNIILFEYQNGKRYQRVALEREIRSGTWYELSAAVHGRSLSCMLDGSLALAYTADREVKGLIGLWTKADSVTFFEGLTLETAGRVVTIDPESGQTET